MAMSFTKWRGGRWLTRVAVGRGVVVLGSSWTGVNGLPTCLSGGGGLLAVGLAIVVGCNGCASIARGHDVAPRLRAVTSIAELSVTSGDEDGEVVLSWDDASNAAAYRIAWIRQSKRIAGDEAGFRFAYATSESSVNKGRYSYTLTGLKPGREYYFVVNPIRPRDVPVLEQGVVLELPDDVKARIGLIRNEPGAFPGYTLFGTRGGSSFLVDNEGRMVHEWSREDGLNFYNSKLLPNGDLMGDNGDELQRIDPAGNVVWRYSPPDKSHHDHLLLPNGNVLLLLVGRKSRDEVIAAGGNPAFVHDDGLDCDYIVEIQPAPDSGGKIVWQWSPWDHLIQDYDADKPNYGVVADHPERIDINYLLLQLGKTGRLKDNRSDWLHANTIAYHAEANQILLLARNYSEIWVVDRSTTAAEAAGRQGGDYGRGGDLLYRWGNPRAHRAGTAADQRLFWPHNAHWIAPELPGGGNILLFNNGDEFEGFYRDYSEILEVDYPLGDDRFGAWPAGQRLPPERSTWRYSAEPASELLSYRVSGAQRLPNGNTLIVAGGQGVIFEVTATGEEVWRYVSPIVYGERWFQGDPIPMDRGHGPVQFWGNMIYRALRYAPDYPGLRDIDLTPKGPIERYR